MDWISTITDFPAWEANNPYSSEDLPDSIDMGTPVFLTLPVPCAELETVDVTGVLLDHLAC